MKESGIVFTHDPARLSTLFLYETFSKLNPFKSMKKFRDYYGRILLRFLSKKTIRVMKLTLFLSILTISQLWATETYSQMTKLTIKLDDVKISDALKEIENQSEFFFLYSPKLIDVERKVNIDAEKESIKDILSNIFDDKVKFAVIDRQVILTPSDITSLTTAMQQLKITGTVTDEKGNPLPGVTVLVKGTTNGTLTDASGKYAINNAPKIATMVFSFVGMTTQEILTEGRILIDVVLKEEAIGLNEVIVIGYGTVKKSDLTGSVSTVTSEKLVQVNSISNVSQALQGQAAGVQVNQRSGQPGESLSIKIRGTNSISASNDPLYVVDGMPLNSLSGQLNPDDIESIEVLKDASSTAIYGSRGANGVIMITTKSGKDGKTKISYDGYFGVQSLRKRMDLINSKEYAQLQNEVATNDGTALPWTQAQIDALGVGTDWQSLVYRSALVQNHNLSFSGGVSNTKFYTSFGYFDQEGIILNSGFKRLSFRANIDQKINDKLNLVSNLSLQNSNYRQANYISADGGGGIPFTTMVIPPTQEVKDAAGNYTAFTGVSWGATNPVGISRELYNPSNSIRLIGNVTLNYEIVSGLSLKINNGIDGSYTKTDYYAPSTLSIGQPGGVAYKNYSNDATFINEDLLTYRKKIENHSFDVLAGITYQSSRSENLNSGSAITFINNVYQDNNLAAAATKAQPGTGYSNSKMVSYLGRINYDFSRKYFVTLTGRYDGSSKFGENNKFAFFPSGSLAWRLSEEQFMKSIEAISNLKIRASYGFSGSQAINPYQTLAQLSNTSVIFNSQIFTGFQQSALANPGLKWETTGQFDLGIDMGVLKDRIQLTADYYNKKTTNLLLNVTLPSSTGFGTVLENVGAVQNRGIEMQLTTNNLIGVFKWTSVLTISHNRTKILDLGKDALGNPITYKEIGAGGNWFPMITGNSMSQLYGYKVLGVYQTDAEAIANGEPGKKAGDYKFWDRDGNGIVDGNDRSILTHLEPKFTFGFNNTFEFKNFDLSLLFVGSYGNNIVNEFRKYNITMNGNWAPTQEAFDKRWKGPGTGNDFDKPSINSGSSIRDYANSLWVENGNYLRLRDITLGYTVSPHILQSIKISSVRIYVSAQNYFTLTKYSGYDVEAAWSYASINGWDRGVYPSNKSWTCGLRVNF
jgi:TonB-linked SusC/RagA family outer membrane protein